VYLRWAVEWLSAAHSHFVKWLKQQSAKADPNLAMLESKMKAVHTKLLGKIKSIKNFLLTYILEQHE
jgi:hypothetical protein